MYDDFDNRDRWERMLEKLRDLRIWKRVAQTAFFALLIWLVGSLLYAAALLQVVYGLFTGRPIAHVLPLGRWLGAWLHKMALFMTWSIDKPPFPFSALSEVMDEDIAWHDEAGDEYGGARDDFDAAGEAYAEPHAEPHVEIHTGTYADPHDEAHDEAFAEPAGDSPLPEGDNGDITENEGGGEAESEKNDKRKKKRPSGKQPPRPDA